MIINKVNQNTLQKSNNVKTDTIIDSNRINELFYLIHTYAGQVFTITKFNLKNSSSPLVYIDGRKCPDYRYDPDPEYDIDYKTNSIILTKSHDLGTKLEVWGNLEIPFAKEDGIVLTHEYYCEKQTFIFELPWEYDYKNKSISVFIDGKMVPPSELVCLNSTTIEILKPAETESTVVFLSRRALLPDNVYGSYFVSQPIGSCIILTGASIPYGYLPLDGSEYLRTDYPGFVKWILQDGNYSEDPLKVTYSQYLLKEDKFRVPDYSASIPTQGGMNNSRARRVEFDPDVSPVYVQFAVKVANAYTDSLNNVYIPGKDEPILKGDGESTISRYVIEAVSMMCEELGDEGTKQTERVISEGDNQVGRIESTGKKKLDNIETVSQSNIDKINSFANSVEEELTERFIQTSNEQFDNLNKSISDNTKNLRLLVERAELAYDRVESSVKYTLGAAKDQSWELVRDILPGDIIDLPASYIVGANNLILSYGGFTLYRGMSFVEVGNNNEISYQVEMKCSIPKGTVLNVWVCPSMADDYYQVVENLVEARNILDNMRTERDALDNFVKNKSKEFSDNYNSYELGLQEKYNLALTEINEAKLDVFERFNTKAEDFYNKIIQLNYDIESNITERANAVYSEIENRANQALANIGTINEDTIERIENGIASFEQIAGDSQTKLLAYQGENQEGHIFLDLNKAINDIIELPIYYIVGWNTLRLSYDNSILYKNIDYEEIGTKSATSKKIKLLRELSSGKYINAWSIASTTLDGALAEINKYKDNAIKSVASEEELQTSINGFYIIDSGI